MIDLAGMTDFMALPGIEWSARFLDSHTARLGRPSLIGAPGAYGVGRVEAGRVIEFLSQGSCRLGPSFPYWLKSQRGLKYLDFSKASILDPIPNWFCNLSGRSIPVPSFDLDVLALSNNEFSGPIPETIGESLWSSSFLSLSGNQPSGSIPESVGLMSSIVLDLAENDFNGSIPTTFGEFFSMTLVQKKNMYLFYGSSIEHYYEESYVVNKKNQSQKFTKTLSLMTRNHISGQIPPSISQLQHLSSLDLSDNGFSGLIPAGMSSLDFLGLCGAPLIVNCQVDDSDKDKKIDIDSSNSSTDTWILYLNIVLGFVAGISVPYTVIAIRRPWWDAYMGYVHKTADRLSYLGHKVARRCRNNLKHN
ncbi:receptor-like protein EIX2 [Pistacia vera]|uniref:receptor-like protein EIX2 n=1 Tax=Pistacia vera TaxID=55513 RepID=UPI00126334D7|nr:receptor-like protein EIX2 [Pistacia vera]